MLSINSESGLANNFCFLHMRNIYILLIPILSMLFFYVVFIFPPICYMKLKNEGFMRRKYILLWLMVIFGIALMILGTTMAILAQADNSEFTDAQRYWCPGNSHWSNSSNITTTMMPLYTSTVSPVSIVL